MIDERQQELASLYALDLLEGAERVQFEAALARDPELQKLVGELRQTSAALAHTAPAAEPPAALRERVFASIDRKGAAGGDGVGAKIAPFPRSLAATVMPWAIAAGFALIAAWFGERYYLAQAQNAALTQQRALADLALKSVQAQLAAEGVVSSQVATSFNALKADTERRLAEANEARRAIERQLADGQKNEAELRRQLAAAEQTAQGARAELVALNERMKREADLARLKIATLASMLNNAPQALAVAIWDPTQQEGVFSVDKLPANTSEQRYELWVIDAKPVSAGVFTVGPDGRAKVTFKPTAPIKTAAKFAVSREKNDGQAAHAAPSEVVMISE